MLKTVVVAVESPKRHPVYKKMIKNTRKFKAHSDKKIDLGCMVEIEESKPISKEKRWTVVKF